jgi:hypothetical protein
VDEVVAIVLEKVVKVHARVLPLDVIVLLGLVALAARE